MFDVRFGTTRRSVALVNHPSTINEFPLANVAKHGQCGRGRQTQGPARLRSHAAELKRKFAHVGCGPRRTNVCNLRTSSIAIGIKSAL